MGATSHELPTTGLNEVCLVLLKRVNLVRMEIIPLSICPCPSPMMAVVLLTPHLPVFQAGGLQ